jgi:phosphate transport system substrate-binding protein
MFTVAFLGLMGQPIFAGEALKVDPKLPDYKPVAGVSGNLNSVGSDTLNNLMTLWAESFRKHYPNVKIQIEGKGSGTAPPALIEGTAQFGPMSRKMKGSEQDKFEDKFGFEPFRLDVAIDCLAVYVNKDNPIKSLSLPEVDAIFSSTRKSGYPRAINSWGQVGLEGDWERRPISLYGRNSASGTYGYFKSNALFKGDYRNTVKEQPGSASVVQGVTVDRFAIGYSGIGYRTSGVRAIPLSKTAGGRAYEPNYPNALSGKYPLARSLYIYTVKHPNKPLDPLRLEFLKFVLSKQGQEIVIKDGYLPLTADMVEGMLKKMTAGS